MSQVFLGGFGPTQNRNWKKKARRRGLRAKRKAEGLKGKGWPNFKIAAFYKSEEWQRLRYDALVQSNGCCLACGRSPRFDGAVLRVDHVKSIRFHPHLRADPTNLQVLCNGCNWGKGGIDETDWRTGQEFPTTADGRSIPAVREQRRAA